MQANTQILLVIKLIIEDQTLTVRWKTVTFLHKLNNLTPN